MATVTVPLMRFADGLVLIDLLYDSVTLVVSGVRVTNTGPSPCGLTVQKTDQPALIATGVIAAGQTLSHAVPPGLGVTMVPAASAGPPMPVIWPWWVSARYPAQA